LCLGLLGAFTLAVTSQQTPAAKPAVASDTSAAKAVAKVAETPAHLTPTAVDPNPVKLPTLPAELRAGPGPDIGPVPAPASDRTRDGSEGGIAGGCVTCTPNEGEPLCGPDYVDATNGGCNSTPAVYSTIACGQTVCGESGTYLVGGTNQYRDTDWWMFTLTEPRVVTWTVTAEFSVATAIISGVCPPTILSAFPTGAACTPTTVTSACLQPGSYAIFVGPSVFTGVDCGSDYTGTLTCEPCGAGPANDNCDGAVAVTIGTPVTGDTTAATPDSIPTCGPFGASPTTAPGLWYSVQGNGSTLTADTCSTAGYDTALTVFCGSCASLTCMGGNDDSCGLQSSFSWCSNPGTTYYILVHGFSTAFGTFTLNVTSGASCNPVACGASCVTCTDNEGEPTCGDEYVDATNGGCNSTPPVFTPIACGQTVCGEAGTYLFQGGQRRDTDWWLVNVTAPNTLTWTVTADFPVLIGFIQMPCPVTTFIPGTAIVNTAPCTPTVSVTPVLAPGQYVAFVAPSVFAGVPCNAKYEATLTGSDPGNCVAPAPLGRCCVGVACSVLTQAQCNTAGGVWTAGGNCPPTSGGYTATNCGNILEDISTTGTLAATVSACDDCSELNVPIGFNFSYYGNTYSTIRICANGFASFNQAGPCPFTNVGIPTGTEPNDMIAPFWDDFNWAIAASGDVRYQTLAGPQRFIIQWTNGIQFGQTTGSATFQMILFATGEIQFRYGTMTPAVPYSATVGVENITGTVGTSIDPSGPSAGNTCRSLTLGPPPPNPCADCPGDTDNDGDVDADDLTNVILQWGNTCPCGADVDNDNDVDSDDLTVVILEWGTPC
jgi:hypothetical protein